MRAEDVCVPVALQFVLDDFLWMYGRDCRDHGEPSRTGMPRYHVFEDYEVVEEIGKAIDQKITMMTVIGEWDRNHILRKVSHSNKWGKNWDATPYLNLPEQERIRDFLNSASHIEMGIHGLLHDLWDDGKYVGGSEFMWPKDLVPGAVRTPAPEWFIREHFDAFLEIYNDWGFRSPLRCFAIPGGGKTAFLSGDVTRILKDYGVQFWHNGFPQAAWDALQLGNCYSLCQNGVLIHRKMIEICPWEAYDLDPDDLPIIPPEKRGIVSGHWVNLLRYNPKRNLERVDAWARYFARQEEIFGNLHSTDAAFAHYQQFYHYHCPITQEGEKVCLDLAEHDRLHPLKDLPPIYISVKKGVEPKICKGGHLTRHSEKRDFINYKIERNGEGRIYLS